MTPLVSFFLTVLSPYQLFLFSYTHDSIRYLLDHDSTYIARVYVILLLHAFVMSFHSISDFRLGAD